MILNVAIHVGWVGHTRKLERGPKEETGKKVSVTVWHSGEKLVN